MSGARFGIFVTVVAWIAYIVTTLSKAFFAGEFSLRFAFDALLYIVIVTLLVASAVAYLLARVGFLYRTRRHERVPRVAIDDFFAESLPTLTAIVPSYREDARVVRQTLLSAALQEYPYLRIVLLIDDPPNPTTDEERALLEAARALPREIETLLQEPRERFEAALEGFESRGPGEHAVEAGDMLLLAAHYDDASKWLSELIDPADVADHAEEFLRRDVVSRLARDLASVADALRRASADGATLTPARMLQLYRRLAWTFRAELTSFERKRYVSCSHEPNKAMNLNSYIGLMGGRYVEQRTPAGAVLVPVMSGPCDLEVPDPSYVLTLDADSILLPEYCLRLVYLLEQPANARVAVAQTPYSAYPGARTRIERIAGATTDLQHVVHQGLTHYGATFWVGANAVLRKRALDDIRQTEREGAFEIHRFIQDRTVIEDTESSIDLGMHGWKLVNYPERLSYSATPPDFGSLCVQRQRWANGGLLVLPKLRRCVRAQRARDEKGRGWAEAFLRMNYLASIAWASFGLLVLLAYPFNGALLSPFALLAAGPYFLAMSADLKRCGYKRLDVVRIYGFNLILLPVNIAGVVKSVGQAIGGQKIAFARTPKVRNRTTAAITFVLVPYLIIAFSLFTIWHDLREQHYPHAAFAAVNAALAAYAVVAFIGVRHSIVDVTLNLVRRLYRPDDDRARRAGAEPDWVTVLYHGAGEATEHGLQPVATPSATLALVGGPELPGGEHDDLVVSVADDEVGPHGVDVRPSLAAAPADGNPFDVLATSLSEYFDHMQRSGRVVVRLDGGAVEFVLEPRHATERSD